jgi:alpha-tubulin suppressor-like RCC1 family protein
VQVEAGTYFGCALDRQGVLRCWGELALDDKPPRGRGGAIEVLREVASFALGADHGCAVTRAGQVRCFGSNVRGQLGTGSAGGRATVTTALGGLSGVRQVSCGAAHSCALDGGGEVRCWGFNAHGQVGDGTRQDRAAPGPGVGLTDTVRIATGGHHSCAIAREGTLRCWGHNDAGQLGLGDVADRPSPERVALEAVAEAALGSSHTCARTRQGQAHCWGLGEGGRLGHGDELDRPSPGAPLELTGVLALAAGDMHTCALAEGGAWCWGVNDGQLGDGSLQARTRPTPVAWPTPAHPASGAR